MHQLQKRSGLVWGLSTRKIVRTLIDQCEKTARSAATGCPVLTLKSNG